VERPNETLSTIKFEAAITPGSLTSTSDMPPTISIALHVFEVIDLSPNLS
jgi:hypothetical protein